MGSPVWDWFPETDPQKRIPVQVTDLKAISGENPREWRSRVGGESKQSMGLAQSQLWPDTQGLQSVPLLKAGIWALLFLPLSPPYCCPRQIDVSSQTLVLSKLLGKDAPAPQCVLPSLEEAGRGVSEGSTRLVGQIQGSVGRAPATVLQVQGALVKNNLLLSPMCKAHHGGSATKNPELYRLESFILKLEAE